MYNKSVAINIKNPQIFTVFDILVYTLNRSGICFISFTGKRKV